MNFGFNEIEKKLKKRKDVFRAKILSRYFKTSLGGYGEGDIFLGISVGQQREVVKEFLDLELLDLEKLLNSKIHEFRFSALLILINKYQKSSKTEQEKIIKFYLKNIKNINNWDLVDISSYKVLGHYLFNNKNKINNIIIGLVGSDNMWARRMAIVSTLYFIKKGEIELTLVVSKKLLSDNHHLIHKAIGWMLREVGKQNIEVLKCFLLDNIKNIPRITLRYAIEKFSECDRKKFLKM